MMGLVERLVRSLRTRAGSRLPSASAIESQISSIRKVHLTYCGAPKLENLAEAVVRVRRDGVVGEYVEAGVALGGSAILLGYLKPRDTPLKLYDVFGMIPPPDENDGEDAHKRYAEIRSGASKGLGNDQYYGYVDNLMERVLGNLSQFGLRPDSHRIELIPGLFEQTLWPSAPIAFAHIDCDWYASVQTCIERLVPKMSKGAVVVFDDYASYSGCRKAVDELLQARKDLEIIFNRRSIGLRLR